MSIANTWRRVAFAALTGVSLAALAGTATIVAGALAPVQAQVSGEFQAALEPYGEWRRNARWGEVWVPDERPPGWRPYSVGHWVYTDDWGWFWVSDNDEADWGWVTYHYGRWIHDRGAWFWVPGDEWAPAWVNWRRGDSYVGWSPLPPDDVVFDYDDDPDYWTFVEPRYVAAPRVRTYFIPYQRSRSLLGATVMVNRTFSANRAGARIAVNPGVSPGVIGAASHSPVPTFRVRPRVLVNTQGVIGAVPVRPQDLGGKRGAPRPNGPAVISVQRTTTMIPPAASVTKPQALGKDERGRLGTHPPRAAQGAAPSAAPLSPQQPAPIIQQHAPASPPPAGAPPRPPSPAPSSPPPPPAVAPPPPPPAIAPRPVPPVEHRDQRPPGGSAPIGRSGEPPPQAKPVRPITPQTPPPPPPAQTRQAPPPPPAIRAPAPPPPPAVRPAPPPPPAARPAPPPAAKPAAKPGEKPPEPPK